MHGEVQFKTHNSLCPKFGINCLGAGSIFSDWVGVYLDYPKAKKIPLLN